MKFNFWELEDISRWLCFAFFIALAVLGGIGIIQGYYLQIITVAGFLSIAYCVLKEWE